MRKSYIRSCPPPERTVPVTATDAHQCHILFINTVNWLQSMRVYLIKLRSRGKKLPPEDFNSPVMLEGNLEVTKYQTNTRSYSYAKLLRQHSGGMVDEICHLYEPKLIRIEGDSMLFDGVEKDRKTGEIFFQQWRCIAG